MNTVRTGTAGLILTLVGLWLLAIGTRIDGATGTGLCVLTVAFAAAGIRKDWHSFKAADEFQRLISFQCLAIMAAVCWLAALGHIALRQSGITPDIGTANLAVLTYGLYWVICIAVMSLCMPGAFSRSATEWRG